MTKLYEQNFTICQFLALFPELNCQLSGWLDDQHVRGRTLVLELARGLLLHDHVDEGQQKGSRLSGPGFSLSLEISA